MRIAFVNPPPVGGMRFIREGRCMQSVASWAALWPPLTLASLAAVARGAGHEVALWDGNVPPATDAARLLDRLRGFAPALAVVNTAFPSIEGDDAFAASVRAACPGAVVAGVGQFFTLLETRALEACPGFDLGIMGEPEAPFAALLETLSAGGDLSASPGLVVRGADGAPQLTPPASVTRDLDALPFPARDLLETGAYRLPHNGAPFTLVNVARGCPNACTFCIAPAYHGHKLRRRSLENVLREIEQCRNDLGLRHFLFWEELFAHDREFALALCEGLGKWRGDIAWAATTRADKVDAELVRAMKQAGCFLLGLGIESASQEILDRARKAERVEDMRRAVALCREAGLQTMGHFIFGLPGETPETAEATVRFAVGLGLDYLQCYAAVPYPKTELGALAEKNGWIRAKAWKEYDFGGPSILDIGTIRPEDVDRFRTRLFRKFYLRPAYLIRRGTELLRHPRQLAQAAGFLRWM